MGKINIFRNIIKKGRISGYLIGLGLPFMLYTLVGIFITHLPFWYQSMFLLFITFLPGFILIEKLERDCYKIGLCVHYNSNKSYVTVNNIKWKNLYNTAWQNLNPKEQEEVILILKNLPAT